MNGISAAHPTPLNETPGPIQDPKKADWRYFRPRNIIQGCRYPNLGLICDALGVVCTSIRRTDEG